MPILFGLSLEFQYNFFGDWDYGLITGALIWSMVEIIFNWIGYLILRLVGVEYDLEKKNSYNKIL